MINFLLYAVIFILLIFITTLKIKLHKNNLIMKKTMLELHEVNSALESSYSEVLREKNRFLSLIKLIPSASDNVYKIEKDFFRELLNHSSEIMESDYSLIYEVIHDKIIIKDHFGCNPGIIRIQIPIDETMNLTNITKFDNKIKLFKHEDHFYNAYIPDYKSAIIVPFGLNYEESDNMKYGIVYAIDTKNAKNFTEEDLEVANSIQIITKTFLKMKSHNETIEKFRISIILSIIRILELHDYYTKGHSKNVAVMSKKFAGFIGLSDDECEKIYWAGLVHDIGKILIPDTILNKPGRLTEGEYEIIKKHPLYGYAVLSEHLELKETAIIIRHHHERYDGTGYPDKLKGESIPFFARIISIVDAYDAMMSRRSYNTSRSINDIISEIENNKRKQFDPVLADAFISMIKKDINNYHNLK